MLRVIFLSILLSISVFADEVDAQNLISTWAGIATLVLFFIGYYIVANEEKYAIDKSIPALFVGIFSFIIIAVYYYVNKLDAHLVKYEIEIVILQIAEIFFFLFVAMTYIESLVHMNVFDRLKYNLISKGYGYKKIFWFTGFLAYFISPIADNLTTALILSTVLITIERERKEFLVPSAINIVVASNAGGVWSPFGDITTLMVWSSAKASLMDFLLLLPASIIGYLITAYFLSKIVPVGSPKFESKDEKPQMKKGSVTIIALGIFTIICAIVSYQYLNFPAMWGMMFGLALLKLYSFRLKKIFGEDHFNIFDMISKIENNTLLFLFGMLAIIGALYFTGWLTLISILYEPEYFGAIASNILVGFVSAVIDNVPVMFAILKTNPDMSLSNWLLVTLTAGIGGSLISFGSAAGIAAMGKLRGIYTFNTHLKYTWTILLGYFVSIGIWYVQFNIFS